MTTSNFAKLIEKACEVAKIELSPPMILAKHARWGSPFSLPSVSNADIQSQRLLTNSTFTTLRQLGDFGDRGLTLRVRFQVANVFFRPGNPLAASICYLALHSHDFLPSMLSYSCNQQFGLVLDGVGLVNSLCSTNCHVAMQFAAT